MNRKQTVGIITFHCADNFGAVLQTYALQSTIEGLMFKVEVIDFQPVSLTSQYKFQFNFSYIFKEYGIFRLLRMIVGRLKNLHILIPRNRQFDEFRRKCLNLSRNTLYNYSELKKDTYIYDFYITGSDQVWNLEFDDNTNNAYFLQFAPEGSTKLSYAASTGKKINEMTRTVLKKKLYDFNSISVREKSAFNILKEFADVNVCLDPTLLLKKEHYIQNLNLRKDTNAFIFVYDLEYNDELVKLVNRVSSEKNMKVISYSNKRKRYKNTYDYLSNKGPIEFLNIIYNANIVITNSFHGTCFSIIFNKDFYCIPHQTKGERMIDLLDTVELSNRIIYKADQVENTSSKIDYKRVNELLEIERIKSISYLRKALNISTP